MEETRCPQCQKPLSKSTCRLVQDACGHKKCRMCLLADEETCLQCKPKENNAQPSVIITKSNCEANSSSKALCDNDRNETLIKKRVDSSSDVVVVVRKKTDVNGRKRNYQSIVIPSHVTTLKDPVSYKCNVCNKVFLTKSHVKYHIYCKGGSKPYQCDICNKEFISKSHLEIHRFVHSGTRPYTCTVCHKSFTLRSKLNRHKLLHTTSKPYVCQECGKSFRSKESLKIHNFVHSGEKPFKCKECTATFNNSSNLNKHLVTHTKEKVHMCDQCGKRFKLKWALTVHKRSHLKIRPHQCANCLKTFVNAKDLGRHKLIHIDVKAYSCGICGVGFRRKDNLERHMRNTHPGKPPKIIKNTATTKNHDQKPTTTTITTPPPPPIVDTPNAIKVITPSPIHNNNKVPVVKTNPVPFMNVPLKLAFKTSAFKNHYNIHRDYIEPPKIHPKPYDLEESVNICQRILTPLSPPPPRNVIEKAPSDLFTTAPLHYETSFEHKKHAVIKNIKFKLPSHYLNTKTNSILGEIAPLKPVAHVNLNEIKEKNGTYAELKTVDVMNGATSVIVKGNAGQSDMHWRRRTLQNHLQMNQ